MGEEFLGRVNVSRMQVYVFEDKVYPFPRGGFAVNEEDFFGERFLYSYVPLKQFLFAYYDYDLEVM
jgi:hypothetical protein